MATLALPTAVTMLLGPVPQTTVLTPLPRDVFEPEIRIVPVIAVVPDVVTAIVKVPLRFVYDVPVSS